MSKCILVCDDNLDILEVTEIILNSKGHRVVTSSNCNDILRKVENAKPDVILMDIRIPDIGGKQAVRLLKANNTTRHIPVIMFSANMNIERVAKDVGADGYLKKPFNIKDMEDVIECADLAVA